jgi:hypothetical protein
MIGSQSSPFWHHKFFCLMEEKGGWGSCLKVDRRELNCRRAGHPAAKRCLHLGLARIDRMSLGTGHRLAGHRRPKSLNTMSDRLAPGSMSVSIPRVVVSRFVVEIP